MRVLVVGPRYQDSFVDNVFCALEDMGHEVYGSALEDFSRYWSFSRKLALAVWQRFVGDGPSRDDVKLLKLARQLRPTLVLALTWDVHPEVLSELSLGGTCRRVLWWGDAPANSQRWGLANRYWDIVYVKDPVAVEKLRLIGTDARLLHEAMNPRWHRVIAENLTTDVVVFGNYYAYRQAIAVRLLDSGLPLALYGPPPPRWADRRIRDAWRRKYIAREEKSRVIGEGLACLNTFAFAEGQSLNCRAFEIAGAGGLQLIEHRPIVEECFEPGKEILPFRSFPELLEHVARARREPLTAMRIREAAAKRAVAEHTYHHRIGTILRDIAS